jgi:DnaJ-class molecular chaperone
MGGGSAGFEDIFQQFFGGGGRRNQKRQLKPTVLEERITLKEAYDGCVKKLKVKRKKVCQGCQGKGGSKVHECTKCKGQGYVVRMVQMGPGMYSQH